MPRTSSLPSTVALSRRLLLSGAAVGLAVAALPRIARAAVGSTRILSISDLHSAYGRMPQLLAAMRTAAQGADDVLIVLNGDLFELANPVATRSRGSADMAFLRALTDLGPVIVNIGNHEPDFVDDMADIVALLTETGVTVLSNITDARTGTPYAPATMATPLAGTPVTVLALATDNVFTYPEAIRPQLTLPDPVSYARDALAALPDGPVLLLTHAGLVADKDILPMLPAGSLAIGGHNHIQLIDDSTVPYAHGGAWAAVLTVLDVTASDGGLSVAASQIDIATDGPIDAPLAATIAQTEAAHLTAEDTASVGTSPRAMGLNDAILFATEAVRDRADADIAVLGHTTFGTGLPAGQVRKYDFNAYIRFDGDIQVAQVDGATLRQILSRANQFNATTLDARTGDYVHAAEFAIDDAATYRLATNGWTAQNQDSYLGTQDLTFTTVEGLTLKAAVMDAMG